MHINWRQRLVQMPQYWDFQMWPVIPEETVLVKERKAYWRNKQVVIQVLCRQPQNVVAKKFHLSPGRVSQLMNRCLGGDDNTLPPLTQGLIPNQHVKPHERKIDLPTSKLTSGSSCAFKFLLDQVPNLRIRLDEFIEAGLKDLPCGQTQTVQGFFGEFKRVLSENHWPSTKYPYTTPSLSSESVRQYFNLRTKQLQLNKLAKKEKTINDFRPNMDIGLLERIQIDEHTIDLYKSIHLMLDDKFIPLRLERATVLVASEVATKCILGYHLVPTLHANQDDLLTLIEQCLSPCSLLKLNLPGVSYLPGATFPSGSFAGVPITFGTVQLDNAMMHYAKSVSHLLADKMGACLSFGFPAVPQTRHLVEAAFGMLTRKSSKRFNSTSGASSNDPTKESRKNHKHPPLITFHLFNEALSLVLSNHNVTPSTSLGGKTPLEIFSFLANQKMTRYLSPSITNEWRPFVQEFVLPIHWYKHENRTPHVNFFYARYHGNALTQALLEDQTAIRVKLNRKDTRYLKAYSHKGELLGDLVVSNPWRRFPHSLNTRQYIHKHTKELNLRQEDPLAGMFRYFLENRKTPKIASHLLRVYDEFTDGFERPLLLSDEKSSLKPENSKVFDWSTQNANHNGRHLHGQA